VDDAVQILQQFAGVRGGAVDRTTAGPQLEENLQQPTVRINRVALMCVIDCEASTTQREITLATTLIQARKLLTAAELEVFVAGRGDTLKAMTLVQLRAKSKRARALRDKYQDLLRRQRLATRERVGSKVGDGGVANARTAQKAHVFADVLERFTRRLAQVEAAAVRAAKQAAAVKAKQTPQPKRREQAAMPRIGATTRSPKAPATIPVSARKVGPTSEGARVARHAMQPKQAGQQRVQAHVAARGRRNQAKRDSRH